MKLLILSDSHGSLKTMVNAVETEQPQVIVHLGDHWRDGSQLRTLYPHIPIYQVVGNCDLYHWEPGQENIQIIELGGVRFYLCHGHQHHVKMSLLRLRLAAQEVGARVALFGHTHSAYLQECEGILLMNPGSCSSFSRSYGVIDVDAGGIRPAIRQLENNKEGSV